MAELCVQQEAHSPTHVKSDMLHSTGSKTLTERLQQRVQLSVHI